MREHTWIEVVSLGETDVVAEEVVLVDEYLAYAVAGGQGGVAGHTRGRGRPVSHLKN